MAELQVLRDGGVMGESPRWHEGRLWFCDWGLGELRTVEVDGSTTVVEGLTSVPWSIDWLPDGRMLVVPRGEQRLLRQEPDGTLVGHGDLAAISPYAWNELVVDGRGNAYVNGIGYDMLGGAPPAPGQVALVTPDGTVTPVADDVHFPNGMAVTADNGTLIVAESHAQRLTAFTIGSDGSLSDRRVWADLGDGAPDGICTDAEGAVWYADVPNRHCRRVADGGEVRQTVTVDRGCFSCALGGPAGTTLFIVAAEWRGPATFDPSVRTGQVLAIDVEVSAAGWP